MLETTAILESIERFNNNTKDNGRDPSDLIGFMEFGVNAFEALQYDYHKLLYNQKTRDRICHTVVMIYIYLLDQFESDSQNIDNKMALTPKHQEYLKEFIKYLGALHCSVVTYTTDENKRDLREKSEMREKYKQYKHLLITVMMVRKKPESILSQLPKDLVLRIFKMMGGSKCIDLPSCAADLHDALDGYMQSLAPERIMHLLQLNIVAEYYTVFSLLRVAGYSGNAEVVRFILKIARESASRLPQDTDGEQNIALELLLPIILYDDYNEPINYNTPLHVAAENDSAEVAKVMLNAVSKKDALMLLRERNNQVEEPLCVAAHNGNAEVMKVMLDKAKDGDVVAVSLYDVLDAALCSRRDRTDIIRLILNSAGDKAEAVRLCKMQAGADTTLLHCVIDWNSAKVIKVISDAVGDKNFTSLLTLEDKNGETPLDLAIRLGRHHSKQAILEAAEEDAKVSDAAVHIKYLI